MQPNHVVPINGSDADVVAPNPEFSAKPAAILVPCSSLKSVPATSAARAVSLSNDSQSIVETAWLATVSDLKIAAFARDLYAGRGFRRAVRLAAQLGAELYVVSAGLGLVRADARIPSYGLTLSGSDGDNITTKITGCFNPSAWWNAVNCGPFATPLESLFETTRGLVLAAVSRPYACMIGPALAELDHADRARLRIVGSRLQTVLHKSLHPFIMPYDDRLNRLVSGAHVDLAQRALVHFAQYCLGALPNEDAAAHAIWVSGALDGTCAVSPPVRRRCSDDVILTIISRYLDARVAGVSRLLRTLRRDEGVACEQSRFGRLYNAAVALRDT